MINATGLAIAAALTFTPTAHADRITLSGTGPLIAIGNHIYDTHNARSMSPAEWYAFNPQIGASWVPNQPWLRLDYKADLLDIDNNTQQAGKLAIDAVQATPGLDVVVGLSQGAMAVDQAMLEAERRNIDPSEVSFVRFEDPAVGFSNNSPQSTFQFSGSPSVNPPPSPPTMWTKWTPNTPSGATRQTAPAPSPGSTPSWGPQRIASTPCRPPHPTMVTPDKSANQ